MFQIKNYIGGVLLNPHQGNYFENINPSTGKVFNECPDSDFNDVEMAINAATIAFPHWSQLSPKERSNYLTKIAIGIQNRIEEFSLAESMDNGKPLSLAKSMDIPRAIENFEYYAGAILHEESQAFHTSIGVINYVHESPVGVVACISPWNLPLYLFTWKIAPALASGCTVVAKPSEVTPYTAYLLSEVCIEIGLPAGVLNIVHGFGGSVGMPLVKHQKVKAVSFTGGTKTGQTIAMELAPSFKKMSLELGGKNPNIIFADADFEKAISTTILSSFRNQGQICLCGSRILVESSIYEKFKNEFVKRVASLKIGNPLEDDTNIGAIVSKAHYEKILFHIDLAKQEGGKILIGGKAVHFEGELSGGFYIEPTVIEGLDENCRTNKEEIFGPVVTIMPFNNEEEAIRIANGTDYGLAATIWTENLPKAHRVAQQIESGIIWVNCWLLRDLRTPFGGMKQSGVGREGGTHALEFFREKRNICIKL